MAKLLKQGMVLMLVMFLGVLSVQASNPALISFEQVESQIIKVDQTGMTLQGRHDGEFLYVSMTGQPTGWMSIGFVTLNGKMNGANMLIVLKDAGEWVVENHVGVGFNHRKIDWPEQATYSVIEAGEDVIAQIRYPLSFNKGFSLSGLELGEEYTMISAISNSPGLRNHGRPGRTSISFVLEEE